MTTNYRDHLERAIRYCGSQARLAAAIGCTQQHISYLLNDASQVSAEIAVKIERATSGAVTRESIRPDLFASDAEQVSA